MFLPKPDIENLTPAIHGGINHLEMKNLGISPKDVLDFSVSINPFGPPPGIWEALSKASIERYPDGNSTELKNLLAIELNTSPENLLIGSGSTELIRLVALAYLGTGDRSLIFQPTYGEYEIACRPMGCDVMKNKASENKDFRLSMNEIKYSILRHHPRIIFICNPNNPTGQYLYKNEIEQILTLASDSMLVLDEAYIAFTDNAWPASDLINRHNLVILRSMTKDFALAGLRLGYAVAGSPIISVLNRVKSPWNVSSLAQQAGIHVLKEKRYIEKCQLKIKEAKEFLTENLRMLGLKPLPSETNFFLIKVSDAAKFRKELLRKGILVRDCMSFGLPSYIRIGTRTLPECQKLIDALNEVERSQIIDKT